MALTEEECKAAVNDIEYDLCELEEKKNRRRCLLPLQ